MGRFSRVLTFLGLAVVVLLIGVAIGWLVIRRTPAEPQMPERKSPSTDREGPTRVPFFSTNARPSHRVLSPDKLPLLLGIAQDTQHPKAGEAKDLLELYLEQDYGTDWNKWQEKLKQWMIDNPD